MQPLTLLLALPLPLSAPRQEAPPPAVSPPRPLTSLLVLDRAGARQRGPVFTDAVERLWVDGDLQRPAEGATVALPDGRQLAWRALESPDGRYSDPALRGGWAYARVDSDEDRVLLLDARGHAHVLVDGTPRGGDVYDLGLTRLPIAVRAGGTDLLFKAGRGSLQAALVEPPAACFIDDRDLTLPDVVRGVLERSQAGVVVVNATDVPQPELLLHAALEVGDDAGFLSTLRIPKLGPLEARKVNLPLPLTFEFEGNVPSLTLLLSLTQVRPDGSREQDLRHQIRVSLPVREPTDLYRTTFVSEVDESVQYYAVRPASPAPQPGQPAGLVLSLHGAGVEAFGQAASYAPKAWTHIVAPTNRRPFGFDWEDWGRVDAVEVLIHAARRLNADPGRTWLTGHSMGGHGVWQLATLYPSLFAAIGPSAGWSDFWSYGGAWEPAADSPVEELLARAANPSRTAVLLDNLAGLGVYVLHGDADDNVPVAQARAMRARLQATHPDFEYHEQPGAGHWWGNECVDWPPLFEFFAARTRRPPMQVLETSFSTFDPAIASRHQWFVIESQGRPLALSRVDASLDPQRRLFEFHTTNVTRLLIELQTFAQAGPGMPAVMSPGQPFTVDIDGTGLEVEWPAGATLLRLRRNAADGSWEAEGDVPAWNRNPRRGGRFKSAFGNRMVFVYGTQGTPEENAWAWAKARYDADVWRYRGNGGVRLLADTEFASETTVDQNLIVYGHADMVAGFRDVVATGAWDVRRGSLRVGGRTLERDDLAFLVVYPRKGSDLSSVGVVAGTGLPGLRLTTQLPYFVSGVGYPDWTVLAPDMLEVGGQGVLGAGFFAENWTVDRGDFAWQPGLEQKR